MTEVDVNADFGRHIDLFDLEQRTRDLKPLARCRVINEVFASKSIGASKAVSALLELVLTPSHQGYLALEAITCLIWRHGDEVALGDLRRVAELPLEVSGQPVPLCYLYYDDEFQECMSPMGNERIREANKVAREALRVYANHVFLELVEAEERRIGEDAARKEREKQRDLEARQRRREEQRQIQAEAAESARRNALIRAEHELRVTQKRCVYCGRPLGFFDRRKRQVRHAKCFSRDYRPDPASGVDESWP
jgi:hypothetical protein